MSKQADENGNTNYELDNVAIQPDMTNDDADFHINVGNHNIEENKYGITNIAFTIESHSTSEKTGPPPDEVQTKQPFVVQRDKKWKISYEYVAWLTFAVLTIFCVVDRFVMNGDCVLGRKGKRVSKIYGDNVGETTANIVWAVTARIIIVAQNMMFYTTLWCIPNFLYEYAPSCIKINGIRDSHLQMHRIIGIFLIGIPSIAHVLVCFVPPLIDKTTVTYHPPSEFNYSTQWAHLNWTKFYDPAAVENWTFNDKYGVHLTSDELYRLLLVIVLFCMLFPLSRSSFLSNRSYSMAMAIHVFSGIWYSIDNIRKITHGLAHVFNLPFMIIWCFDRLYSIYLYRRFHGEIVKKVIVGDHKYIKFLIKLNGNKKHTPGVGDIYYMKENKGGIKSMLRPERSHPFTSFSNHGNKDKTWDIGFVMTIMDDSDQWYPAYTRRIAADEATCQGNLAVWGPYRSSNWQLRRELLEGTNNRFVLFCSGSGFGYLLDTLGLLAYGDIKNTSVNKDIEIYYTVRYDSFRLAFIHDVEDLLQRIKKRGFANVKFLWYVTESSEKHDGNETQTEDYLSQTNHGRIDFERIISRTASTTPVFFVGRPSLADRISAICQRYNVTLVKDHTNSERGVSDKTLMVTYLKYTAYALVATAVASLLLSIYLDN